MFWSLDNYFSQVYLYLYTLLFIIVFVCLFMYFYMIHQVNRYLEDGRYPTKSEIV